MIIEVKGVDDRKKAAKLVGKKVEWTSPAGTKPIAEYWLQTSNPSVIISEADNVAPIMAASMPWIDTFDMTTVPAVTAEEGLKLASEMMPKT